MNRKTVEVFHALLKHGWIDRSEDSVMWSYAEEQDVREELEDFKAVMGIDLIRTGNRLYMVPTQENDLFLKNNEDYRRDIKADNTVRLRDLYLMNYLSIYLLYLFFSGQGSDPLCRDFITRETLVEEFTSHCKSIESGPVAGEDPSLDYGDNFRQLAEAWLGKKEGDTTSQKFDNRYGIVNRILNKYKADLIFETTEDGRIFPTRKTKDLMPYFLRKERIREIQNWIRRGETNAATQ